MSLRLLKKGTSCPFETHPDLETIWSSQLAALAKAAINDWLQLPNDTGEVFLIQYFDYPIDWVVGITWWWPLDDTRAGLRWHGIIEEYRSRGLSKKAIRELCNLLPHEFSELVEVTMSDQPVEHFFALGFVEVVDERQKEELFDLVGGYGHRFLTLDVNIYRERNFL
jgi:hypothetical protein